ncbi:MAG: cytochrome c maturation protein CcmE [Bacteroidia bacterium]|nr:cytochrome c maturation protein CcmE [Bacteroidia bacterium]NNC85741.1 cytochrome c maturation protein CcmE [Bacteroidia bacterium]NNM16699.1 cytochrome c maturation protein CcmE [Bacteroidia bacterium]
MKKTHIVLLVLLAVAFAAIVTSISDSTSYASFAETKQSDKTFHVVGVYNKEKGYEYDPEVNVNLFSFYLIDQDSIESKVVFNGTKPQDFERSEQIVIVGKNKDDYFAAKKILMKCPSKYNDGEMELQTFEAEV